MSQINGRILSWICEEGVVVINIENKITQLTQDQRLIVTKFVLAYNKKDICYWIVRYIQTKRLEPIAFHERFINIILLTRRLLSRYGVKDEGMFYNNLEFNGFEVEENNAKLFADECEECGMIFLEEEFLDIPNSNKGSDDLPKETANLSPFKYSPKSSSQSKKPFTPEGECVYVDYHDHAIPLSQMAQKIPKLLDSEFPPRNLGIFF